MPYAPNPTSLSELNDWFVDGKVAKLFRGFSTLTVNFDYAIDWDFQDGDQVFSGSFSIEQPFAYVPLTTAFGIKTGRVIGALDVESSTLSLSDFILYTRSRDPFAGTAVPAAPPNESGSILDRFVNFKGDSRTYGESPDIPQTIHSQGIYVDAGGWSVDFGGTSSNSGAWLAGDLPPSVSIRRNGLNAVPNHQAVFTPPAMDGFWTFANLRVIPDTGNPFAFSLIVGFPDDYLSGQRADMVALLSAEKTTASASDFTAIDKTWTGSTSYDASPGGSHHVITESLTYRARIS